VPQSVLSANRVLELLAQPLEREGLEEQLFRSKAELTDWTEDALTIEVTPDRLDMLSEGGLALFLQGALGLRKGPAPLVEPPATLDRPAALVEAAVSTIRPYLAGAVLTAPPGVALDAGLFAEAIRFQEVLHATIGLDRRAASLGLYAWERLKPPVRYTLEPVDGVRFHPLDGLAEVDGPKFFAEHPMAQKYGRLGRTNGECLTLRDADDQLLSLPPILNGRTAGEVRIGDRALLLESTGTRAVRVEESVGLMLLPFVARGWAVQSLRVEYPDHAESGVGWIAPRRLPFTASTLQDLTGLSLPDNEVEEYLAQARLGGAKAPDGWWVEIPPWRPDLQTSVDLTEEILVARGISSEEALLPPSATRGRQLAETRFRRTVRRLLLGLGYVELRNPVLVPDRLVTLLGNSSAISVVNPVSELFSRVRDSLQISLMGSLERNVRYSYPQQYSDVGPVVVRDSTEPSGGRTRWHAGVVLAGERSGFADAASWVDYVLGAFGALGVREPAELPGTTPGRAARLRIAGEVISEMGEIAPSVLTELKIPVAVAWAELDLTALWPLVRRSETP
jgi:phenylalanyl-tRNA synthetase beta chain